jgi:hypothetical protein
MCARNDEFAKQIRTTKSKKNAGGGLLPPLSEFKSIKLNAQYGVEQDNTWIGAPSKDARMASQGWHAPFKPTAVIGMRPWHACGLRPQGRPVQGPSSGVRGTSHASTTHSVRGGWRKG